MRNLKGVRPIRVSISTVVLAYLFYSNSAKMKLQIKSYLAEIVVFALGVRKLFSCILAIK